MSTRDMTVIHRPTLGEHGAPCGECGAPLADDQRYCLTCGARRTGPRVAYRELLKSERPAPEPAVAPSGERDWTPLLAVGVLGGLAIVLIVGVLIGKSSFGDGKGGSPQVIRVAPQGAGGTATPTAAANAFKSDWAAGKEGWTIELGEMPKSGSTPAAVQKAKDDAKAKGAADVGALDSDQFQSLPAGNYVVYSGVFDSKGQAAKALKALKDKFPDAKVVQVSSSAPSGSSGSGGNKGTADNKALKDLGNASGDSYQKKSRKLPTTVGIPGKPPPVDHGAPGAGSSGETIK